MSTLFLLEADIHRMSCAPSPAFNKIGSIEKGFEKFPNVWAHGRLASKQVQTVWTYRDIVQKIYSKKFEILLVNISNWGIIAFGLLQCPQLSGEEFLEILHRPKLWAFLITRFLYAQMRKKSSSSTIAIYHKYKSPPQITISTT